MAPLRRPYLEFLGKVLLLAGLGIFRNRVWDIDRLVNCTLVHGLLTAIFGAVYVGLVLALSQLLVDRHRDAEPRAQMSILV